MGWIRGVYTSKCEVCAVQALKAYRGNRGTAVLILNLGIRWMWVVSLTSWSLYPPPGKNSGTHLIRGLVGPEFVWTFRRKCFCSGWCRAPDCPASSLVTTLTELSTRVRRIYTVFYALLRSCKLTTEQKENFVWVSLVFCGTQIDEGPVLPSRFPLSEIWVWILFHAFALLFLFCY